MFLISLFFFFPCPVPPLNNKPTNILYLYCFLVKLHSLYSMPVKYFCTNVFSHVEQTYIKEIVIYKMKIDVGQTNMHTIMSLSKKMYQETNWDKQGIHDRAQMQKGSIQEVKAGTCCKGRV